MGRGLESLGGNAQGGPSQRIAHFNRRQIMPMGGLDLYLGMMECSSKFAILSTRGREATT